MANSTNDSNENLGTQALKLALTQAINLVADLEIDLASISTKTKLLKKQGISEAKLHMRAGRYAILVFPQKKGIRPNPKYIGTNEVDIEKAVKAIKRFEEFETLKDRNEYLTSVFNEAQRAVNSLIRILKYKK